MTLTPAAYVLLFAVGVVLPALAFAGKKRFDAISSIPRTALYLETIALQVALLIGSLLVMRSLRLQLPLPGSWTLQSASLIAALFVGMIGVMLLSTYLRAPSELARLEKLLPASQTERLLWPLVSLAAAAGEETTYRAVLPAVLESVTGDWFAAAAISSVAFALAHVVQGWPAAVISGLFGFLFAAFVRPTGNLGGAILVHFLYDLIAGFLLPLLIRRHRPA